MKTTKENATITIKSEHDQYSDYPGYPDGEIVEVVTMRDGGRYLGLDVCPRGFANERAAYVVSVQDTDGIAALRAMRERNYTSDAGESYSADWMTRKALAVAINDARDSAAGCSYMQHPTQQVITI